MQKKHLLENMLLDNDETVRILETNYTQQFHAFCLLYFIKTATTSYYYYSHGLQNDYITYTSNF